MHAAVQPREPGTIRTSCFESLARGAGLATPAEVYGKASGDRAGSRRGQCMSERPVGKEVLAHSMAADLSLTSAGPGMPWSA